jgi:uncharacterized protein
LIIYFYPGNIRKNQTGHTLMYQSHPNSYVSFDGHRRIAIGSLQMNVLAVKEAFKSEAAGPVLIFDNSTGRTIDVDTRGTDEELCARFADALVVDAEPFNPSEESVAAEPKGRGRPKLGVVPREVTLLPRHWEWLASQPGGASIALRKLVEEARRAGREKDNRRKAQERAYHFLLAIAGDLPGFEEITRALFANDQLKVHDLLAAWPSDVREHAIYLAFAEVAVEQ